MLPPATSMPSARRPRLADRFGIIPRLLGCSILAIVLAVGCVLVLTVRSIEANGLRQVQESLKSSMALLRHELEPLGNTWHAENGQLLLGTTPLNGRNDLVDAVRDISGASATIFLGDVRIATNIKNRDGSRGIGTKLAPGPARASVLDTHTTYRGIVPILGARYLAVYEPIRDAHAQTIGILFVGVPLTEAEQSHAR